MHRNVGSYHSYFLFYYYYYYYSSLSPGLLRLVNQSRDKGASSWLNAMPLADQGLALNKQEFRDSLRLRYGLPLVDLPSHCICGDKFTVGHALSCKKGGFVAQRHDCVRNLLTTFIDKICNNVEIEPRLQPLDNEQFHLRSAVTSSEAFSKREGSGQEELRHFLMSELCTSTPSVTRASQHRKCSGSKKMRRSANTSSRC